MLYLLAFAGFWPFYFMGSLYVSEMLTDWYDKLGDVSGGRLNLLGFPAMFGLIILFNGAYFYAMGRLT